MTKPKAKAAPVAKETAPHADSAALDTGTGNGQKFNLAKMRSARFEGFDRAQLNKAAEMLLSSVPDDDQSNDDVIAALCASVGLPRRKASGEQLPPGERDAAQAKAAGVALLPQPKLPGFGKIPNLSSTGRWEGRRRKVQFGDANNPENTISLGWDVNQTWVILCPDVVSMPWPYWQRVKDSVLVDDRSTKARKFDHDENGKLFVITKPKRKNVYNFTDLGDEPGTEHLPLSYWDFFRKEGLKNHCFRGFRRPALIMIYNRLRDTQNSRFFEGKDNEALRRLIAEILDPQLVAVMDEEAYGEDAGAVV